MIRHHQGCEKRKAFADIHSYIERDIKEREVNDS